jgi:hypothetical protein
MTELEIKINSPAKNQNCHFDALYEIYKLRKQRSQLISYLKNFKKLLKSENFSDIKYKFEALKVVIKEKDSCYINLVKELHPRDNFFSLIEKLEQTEGFLKTLRKERKKGRVDLSQYVITKGYYLQKLLDIKSSLEQLKASALSHIDTLKDNLINFEDQRIVLTTEKLRKDISKEEFKEKIKILSAEKQKLEEKIAFLQVEIIDNEFEKNHRGGKKS